MLRATTYRLELDTAPETSELPQRAEVERYYQDNLGSSGPPLAEIYEHVVMAMRHTCEPREDRLALRAAGLELHLLCTLGQELGRVPEEFVTERYSRAAEGVSRLGEMMQELDDHVLPKEIRCQLAAQVASSIEVLSDAAQWERGFRLVPGQRRISFEEQIAVMKLAGVCLHEGTTEEQLLFNWTRDDWEAEPWQHLFDLYEHTDDATELCLKVLETEDDRQAYSRIAEHLRDLAKGALPLSNVESDVDFACQRARCAFDLGTTHYEWNLDWHGEWIDSSFLGRLDKLLRRRVQERQSPVGFYSLEDPDPGEAIALFFLDTAGYYHLKAAGAPIVAVSQRFG